MKNDCALFGVVGGVEATEPTVRLNIPVSQPPEPLSAPTCVILNMYFQAWRNNGTSFRKTFLDIILG